MREQQRVLNVADVRGEGLSQLRTVCESDEKGLVFGVELPEQLRGCLPGDRKLVRHAAAGIENDPEAEGRVGSAERNDGPLLGAVENTEVAAVKPEDVVT